MSNLLDRLGSVRLDRRTLLQVAGAAAVSSATKPIDFLSTTSSAAAEAVTPDLELVPRSSVAPLEELIAKGPTGISRELFDALEHFIDGHANTITSTDGGKALSLPTTDGSVNINIDSYWAGVLEPDYDIYWETRTAQISFSADTDINAPATGFHITVPHEGEAWLSKLIYADPIERMKEIFEAHPDIRSTFGTEWSDTGSKWTYVGDPYEDFSRIATFFTADWHSQDLRPVLTSIQDAVVSGDSMMRDALNEVLNNDSMTTIAEEWARRIVTNLKGEDAVKGSLRSNDEYRQAFASFSRNPDWLSIYAQQSGVVENSIRDRMIGNGADVLPESSKIPYEPQSWSFPDMSELHQVPEIAGNILSKRGLANTIFSNAITLAEELGILRKHESTELEIFTGRPIEFSLEPETEKTPRSINERAESV
jgi:hypothetical protein